MARLLGAEAKAVAPEAEFEWIAKGRAADKFYRCASTEAHLQKPAAEFVVSSDTDDAATTASGQAVE